MEQVRRRRKRKKKKSYKKVLWVTLASLVIVGGSGWGGFYYATHRDVEAADIGVEEDFFDFSNFMDDSLTGGAVPGEPSQAVGDQASAAGGSAKTAGNGNGDKGGSVQPEGVKPASTGSDGVTGQPSKEALAPTTGKAAARSDKDEAGGQAAEPSATVDPKQAIENKYASILEQLQSAALARLDTLAANAVNDYRRGRSVADISSTYMSAANKLQGAVDGAFGAQVSHMRQELKNAGFSTEAADKAEAAYAAAVSAKKSEMLAKAESLAGL